jgi:hypothetical protein
MIDLRSQLAALPRHPQAQPQDAPLTPRSITFHYSAVVYSDRSPVAEQARVFAEVRYQLQKNWGTDRQGRPIYGSRYQYHFLVYSDGRAAILNDLVQLWHCGNAIGNRESIAVHVMLGGHQDVTPAQQGGLFTLFDELRQAYAIPRDAVYGHCEWPRGTGPAVPRSEYHMEIGQSACPGRTLFDSVVAAYRAGTSVAPPTPTDAPATTYRARAFAYIRQYRTTASPRIGQVRRGDVVSVARLVEGERVELGGQESNLWAELADGGYIWLPQLAAA